MEAFTAFAIANFTKVVYGAYAASMIMLADSVIKGDPWKTMTAALLSLIMILIGFMYQGNQRRLGNIEKEQHELRCAVSELATFENVLSGTGHLKGLADDVAYLRRRERELTIESMELKIRLSSAVGREVSALRENRSQLTEGDAG